MSAFSPTYEGTIDVPTLPSDFTDRIARRVETGLLVPGSRRRANYVVSSKSADSVAFTAIGFWTAYNIGLNDVMLQRAGPKSIGYQGRFWRWATFAAVQAFVIALVILAVILFLPSARAQVNADSWGWLFIAILLAFFGLIWPWILVAMHRRFAARALERIVRQVVTA